MAQLILGERVGRQGKLAVGCSASVMNETGERMLLIKRADNGRWAVPGGYMEPGENFSEACEREVLEETGLQVKVERLIAIYTDPDALLVYPDGNKWQLVVLHFAAQKVAEVGESDGEVTAVSYCTHPETLQLDMGPLDRQRVADGFAGKTAVFIHNTIV